MRINLIWLAQAHESTACVWAEKYRVLGRIVLWICPMTPETYGAYCPSGINVEIEAKHSSDSDTSKIRTGKCQVGASERIGTYIAGLVAFLPGFWIWKLWGELKVEGFIQLKNTKKLYVCLADWSQFSVLCMLSFKKCMMNHTCPVLIFYSVSCGPSDAYSIIRGRFQRRHVRNDAIPRKRALCCLFNLM